MPLVLVRVDERLIHGQVVLGWGSQLRPDRYLVVDDELSASDWEQELYRLGAAGAEVFFAGVGDARALMPEWRAGPARSILLVRDVAALAQLAAGGLLAGLPVNLGGLHHGPGRRQVLTYLHLSGEDVALLSRLEEEGLEIRAQDLPDASSYPLRTLVGT